MSGVNKVILLGNLGQNPEEKALGSGQNVCNLNIATDEFYIDKEGMKQTYTEWHRVVAFGRLAEVCGQYLRKGSRIYVEGRVRTSDWVDEDGKKRYFTRVVASRVEFLDRFERKDASGTSKQPKSLDVHNDSLIGDGQKEATSVSKRASRKSVKSAKQAKPAN